MRPTPWSRPTPWFRPTPWSRAAGYPLAAVLLLVALAAPALAAPAFAAPAFADPALGDARHAPRGSLVLVGGALADDNDAVYSEIINRAGGATARIGVLTAASIPASQDPDAGDPERCSNSACNGAYYANLFTRHGAAAAEWIPVDLDHIGNADSAAVVAQVNRMTGFFFGGGDQYRYVTTLLGGDRHTDSPVLAAIRARFAAGAVISGSSAGAQIASGRDMVTGGDSYEALRDGSRPGYFDDPSVLGYLPAGGFGLLTSGLIDTHNGVDGREGRSLRLAADTGHDRVYALDENTALVVDRPTTALESLRVLGEHGVTVLDLARSRVSRRVCGWSVAGVTYDYLTNGDRYLPAAHLVRLAVGARMVAPTDRAPIPANDDVFSSVRAPAGNSYSLLHTALSLGASAVTRSAVAHTFETSPRFDVALGRLGDAALWANPDPALRSVVGLRLAVTSAGCAGGQ